MTRVDIPRHLAWGYGGANFEVYDWITERIHYSQFRYKSWTDVDGTSYYYLLFQDPKIAMLFKLTWL